jgi:hypothetical protein
MAFFSVPSLRSYVWLMQREALFERSTHSGTDDIATMVSSQIPVIDVFRTFFFVDLLI